jgi:hypothetical protein
MLLRIGLVAESVKTTYGNVIVVTKVLNVGYFKLNLGIQIFLFEKSINRNKYHLN